MPVIVAFGDSNTWGFVPGSGDRLVRFPPDVRWPGVMARTLGQNFQVIEEGLCGRTTMFDDPEEPGRNGLPYFLPCLISHAPLDCVIVSLGCNDTKAKFTATPAAIAAGAERLIETALASGAGPGEGAPRILLVAPPPMSTFSDYAEMFEGAAQKALELPAAYRALAERRGVGFVNAGEFIRCSPRDGIHYEPDQHAALGVVLAEAVGMMLSD